MEPSQYQAILDALANLTRQTEKQAENFSNQLSAQAVTQAAKVSKLTIQLTEQQVTLDLARHTTPKVKQENESIAKMKLGFGSGSQHSGSSSSSQGSADVQFLRAIIKPQWADAATLNKTKQEQYMLAKIQSEYKAKIPVLTYTAPTDQVPAVSNCHEWRQSLLQYYTVISPVLACRND